LWADPLDIYEHLERPELDQRCEQLGPVLDQSCEQQNPFSEDECLSQVIESPTVEFDPSLSQDTSNVKVVTCRKRTGQLKTREVCCGATASHHHAETDCLLSRGFSHYFPPTPIDFRHGFLSAPLSSTAEAEAYALSNERLEVIETDLNTPSDITQEQQDLTSDDEEDPQSTI